MADIEQTPGQSKSAKRRAAKKARDAEGGNAEEVAAPAPVKSNKENNGNAKPKAEAKPSTPAPAEEPKAKAKAKAKPKAEPKEEPKAEPKAPAPKAKSEAKAAAKPAAKPTAKPTAKPKAMPKKQEEEEKQVRKESDLKHNYEIDDGTGGDWEVSSGLTKAKQKRKDRIEEEKAQIKAATAAQNMQGVPSNQQRIPGMVDLPGAKAGTKGGDAKVVVANAAAGAAGAAAAKAAEQKEAAVSNTVTLNVPVPMEKIGIVIGPKGAKIKVIQEKTGVTRIDTSMDDRGCFTITGTASAAAQAKQAIEDLIEKGYTALAYDNFDETQIAVHPSAFPNLIGTKGAVIIKIKEELGVEITIPKIPPNAPPGKKFKVTLAGTPTQVEKAKQCINDILMYYHSEITHPGEVHEELDMTVKDPSLRFIIGTKGSELKHIQNNYKVRLNIPREHSANQKVVVVGEKIDVERAKAYIDKVLWGASQPRGRGAPDQADDGWGEDAAEEDWMKPYLFKR